MEEESIILRRPHKKGGQGDHNESTIRTGYRRELQGSPMKI